MQKYTHKVELDNEFKAEIERFASQYPGYLRADYRASLHEEIHVDLEGNKSITSGYHIYATVYYNVEGIEMPVFTWATDSLSLVTKLISKLVEKFEVDLIPVD